MQRNGKILGSLAAAVAAFSYFPRAAEAKRPGGAQGTLTQGALMSVNPRGEPMGPCPLKHTDVKAEISGFLTGVSVTQEFENPYPEKIEAVYTFPLPHRAAVDDMTMKIGARTVLGKIARREEARAIYESARDRGYAASLLDQERPNIFTQSVANIRPGEKVIVTIHYVETLAFEDGAYEFVFPMVVAPRYIPGHPTGKDGGGWAPDTDRVGDASHITPQVTPPGTRAGHDISIEVALDAGVPVNFLRSLTHDVDIERPTPRTAILHLKNKAEIPNKDFVLQYDVSGTKVQDAVLTHRDRRGGYFTLILQPPARSSRARDYAQGAGLRAGHLRLDERLSHREGEGVDEAGARRSESAGYLQSDHLFRRHAYPVPAPGSGYSRESAGSAGFPRLAPWQRRHRDDEGDSRLARAFRR